MTETSTTPVITGNRYDKYGTTNPIERSLMNGFFDRLHRALPSDRPVAVLEVGIGEAEVASDVSRRYDDIAVVGIDLPDKELAAAWTGKPVVPAHADIVSLPFAPNQFDLVLAIEVLEHVPDPTAALREIARVGCGDVVLSVPREPIWRVANMARGRYWKEFGNTPGHIQHWTTRGFRALVAEHLDVLGVYKPFPWTMIRARTR